MTQLSASPLAHALNDLSEESLTSIAHAIGSGRPGLTAPEKQVQELLDAGIVEHAKDGISEFPLRIPADVWERINQLSKLVDRLRRDGRLGPNKLRMIEESCDRDLAASKSEGGPVGWTASIVYFLATRMALLAILVLILIPAFIVSVAVVVSVAFGQASAAFLLIPVATFLAGYLFWRVLRRGQPDDLPTKPTLLHDPNWITHTHISSLDPGDPKE